MIKDSLDTALVVLLDSLNIYVDIHVYYLCIYYVYMYI